MVRHAIKKVRTAFADRPIQYAKLVTETRITVTPEIYGKNKATYPIEMTVEQAAKSQTFLNHGKIIYLIEATRNTKLRSKCDNAGVRHSA